MKRAAKPTPKPTSRSKAGALPLQRSLAGRVYVVTGGAKRIGRAIVLHLAARGASIVLHVNSSRAEGQELATALRKKGTPVALVVGDLTHDATPKAIVRAARKEFGRLDGFVNNASVFHRTPEAELTVELLDQFHAVNTRAPYLCMVEAARFMREAVRQGVQPEGRIVNLLCQSIHGPWSHYAPYCASKAGLYSLTCSLARLYAPEVYINGVAPGHVLDPSDGHRTGRDLVVDSGAAMGVGRQGRVADVVDAVLFLLEPERKISGRVIDVALTTSEERHR
ncbi:MAG TPA: SDR family NAD(P)-dependent oxidoreductase [Planctomycetota bacterium]|nr:SDR family NAD(P)-dependent oxidoreductase [Planctomycetota bacterium]